MTTITLSVGPRLAECYAFLTHEIESRDDLSDLDKDVLVVLRGYIGSVIILLTDVDTLYLSGPRILSLIRDIASTIEIRKANGPISARMACIEIAGSIRDILSILSERALREKDTKLSFGMMRFLHAYASTKTMYPYEQPLPN